MSSRRDVCHHKDTCEMYELLTLSESLKLWKSRYCDARYEACIRYERASAGQPVPPHLLPNGVLLKLPENS